MRALEIARIVEFAEANAFADMARIAPPPVVAALGLDVRQFGSAVGVRVKHSQDNPGWSLFFNGVYGLGIDEPVTEPLLDAIVAWYREADLRFRVALSPEALPREVPEWLEARGLARDWEMAKLYRTTAEPPTATTDVRIERIGAEHARPFYDICSQVFNVPESMRPLWESLIAQPQHRHYLAFDHDRPIATASLFVYDRVGWLANGATLERDRRRGAQSALIARRVQDAAACGCRWVVTEPIKDGQSYHNMLKAGFQVAYQRPNYVL